MDKLDTFLNKGYSLLKDEKLLKTFDMDSLDWGEKGHMGVALAKRDATIDKQLERLADKVSDNYVMPIFGSHGISKIEVVNGLDKPTLEWHNDLIEGPNLGCLLYYDDTDEDTGGSISFRFKKTKEVTAQFYPKKYNILFINHSLRFQHIVEEQKMPVPRRVISMNFNIHLGLTK